MNYRAVIFDLFDTLLYITDTGTRDIAIARAGELGLTREQWVEGWRSSFELSSRGRFSGLAERVRHLFTQAGLPQPSRSAVEELVLLLDTRYSPTLYPDVVSGLETLRTRGFRAGLLSNISADEVHLVRPLLRYDLFDAVTLSCEVGMAKPEPECYRLAAQGLDLTPEQCLFVDDQPPFVAGARAVGMGGVRISRPNGHDAYGLADTECELRITRLQELLDWLPAHPV